MGCIALVPGCFYIKPAWEPVDNEPPTILFPGPDETTLFLRNDVEQITLVASDPEGDNVSVIWLPPGPFADFQSQPAVPDGNVWVASATLGFDEALDGMQLEVIVTDGVSEETAEFVWDIVIP